MNDSINFNEHIKSIQNLSKEQFQALSLMSEILNNTLYEDTLIEETLDWVINIINAERGLFVKYNETSGNFEIINARHINKESITDLSEFSSGLLKKVIEKKEPILYHDVMKAPGVSQFESVFIRKIKSVIAVPILRNEQIWGIILADSQKNRKDFNESNLLFLNFISNIVSLSLDKIIEYEKIRDENSFLKKKVEEVEKIPELVGNSKVMTDLTRIIHKVAAKDITVLILGESGTGKDIVAQSIHKLSSRRNHHYIPQFCGSIPDSLLESELFGYKKGAFTGATSDKKGLLEVAEKGTFFLDEIADISTALQAKLLRVIENREIIRLGDAQPKKIDIRIITATNKDLKQLINEGKFREDLYYRLNVFPIFIPPLRERKEDIIPIAEDYIRKSGNNSVKLTPKAINKLHNFHWPGNIRQLINVLQRALVICDADKIDEEHIIIEYEKKLINHDGTLRDFENQILLERLEQFKSNRTKTAESLGVSVRWVQLKLKELGIQ